MEKTIREIFPGTTIKVERNGELEDWIVTSLSDDKSVVILKDVLEPSRRMHSSNVSVYDGCEMDLYLENEESGFLSGFSPEMLNCLVPKEIQTYVYGDSSAHIIARRCFLLSEDNLFGNNNLESEPFILTDFLKVKQTDAASTSRIGRDKNGTAQSWCLRSPSSAAQFRGVSGGGGASSNNATNSYYLRPALSVANATIVSFADGIVRLQPNPDKTYREVECIGYVGSCIEKPEKARVIVDAVNLYDVSVEVSSNAKDAEPVWVDAIGGAEVELNNNTKTSENWEICVRLKGKSNSVGYFTEPCVLIV